MSSRSWSDRISGRNGGIGPLVVRTKALNASSGSAVRAITRPLLVAIEPSPAKSWHCQQPFLINAALPFWASPSARALPGEAAQAAKATAAAKTCAAATRTKYMIISSPRLRHDIDQCRLAVLHHGDRFLDRGTEIGRVGDWSLRPPSHRLCEVVIGDVRVHDAGADRRKIVSGIGDAVAQIGEPLYVHRFLMIAAIVVHDGEQRDFVPRGGPKHARRKHEVAIGLDGDRKA